MSYIRVTSLSLEHKLTPRHTVSITIQPERQTLEARYESLRSELSVVGRRLNELTQPSRLPPELLAEVFTYLNPFHPENIRGSAGDLVVASHVCHHWRQVALQFPRLWSNIALDAKFSFVVAALERSKSSELNLCDRITFDSQWKNPVYDEHRHEELLDLLFEEIQRIRSLRNLDLFNSFVTSTLQARFPQKIHAPRLLVYVENDYIPAHLSGYSNPHWENSLLSMLDAPNLESLCLRMTSEGWKLLPSYTHLRHLTIISWFNMPIPDNMDILQVLRALPLLETVNLQLQCSNTVSNTVNEHGFEIFLPQLYQIRLQGDLHSCASLLRHLAFPLTASIVVDISQPVAYPADPRQPSGTHDDALYIANKVAAGNTDTPGVLSFLQLTFQVCTPNPWYFFPYLRVWTKQTPGPPYYPSVNSNFGAEISIPSDPTTALSLSPWKDPVFTASRRIDIVSLQLLEPDQELDFAEFSSVEELSFSQSSLEDVNKLLTRYDGNGRILFPKLRTIHIDTRPGQICDERSTWLGLAASCAISVLFVRSSRSFSPF